MSKPSGARSGLSPGLTVRLLILMHTIPSHEEQSISGPSLRHAIAFLSDRPWPDPELVLVPSGNVQASWKNLTGQFVVQFLPDGSLWVCWVNGTGRGEAGRE